MKILIQGINYHPELTGIGKYTGEMAEWLACRGHEVRVITAPPYYPAWEVSDGYSGIRYSRETLNGVDVIRCPLWVPRKPTGLKRIIHMITFSSTSFPPMIWSAMRWRPDVVMVLEPPIACAPTALLAARVAGSTSWLHIQDYEVDAAFDLGILSSELFRKVLMGVERWIMRRFSRVSTISPRMLDKALGKGVEESNAYLFPNWVDTDLIRPLNPGGGYRSSLGIRPDQVVLLYSGNMGAKQGLDVVAECVKRFSGEDLFQFVFCGAGSGRKELQASLAGLGHVHFLDLQPLERLNELLNSADIHLLPQRPDVEDLVMPSKLTAMLASGRPTIAMARPGTQVSEVVRSCGIVVEPGSADALEQAIRRLAQDPDARNGLGSAGREYAVRHWGRDQVLERAWEGI